MADKPQIQQRPLLTFEGLENKAETVYRRIKQMKKLVTLD